MSLEPEFFSHVYGAIFLASGGAAAIAITAMFAVRSSETKPAHLHAIGNMLLAAVMFWAYLLFGQVLIQWIGDIPREIVWYLRRTRGIWTSIVIATALLHFGIPFLLLLVKALKRTRALAWIAGMVVLGHLLDCALLVLPATSTSGAFLPVALVPIACAAVVVRVRMSGVAPVPTRDPLHEAALEFEMPS
jgi:hypothetical protein